jgi:hypothetical protein
MSLSNDEVRDVLARAQEIQGSLRYGPGFTSEIESVVAAAEEVGISREAVERALRERLDLPLTPPEPGSLVFAHSTNGRYYAAEVLGVEEGAIQVRFLRGSQHRIAMDEFRPASLVPGAKVVCDWPWWGAWTCSIISFDSARQRVKVSDGWGYTRSFPLAEVWLPPRRAEQDALEARKRVYAKLLGVGAALGAVFGSLLTLLLT